MTSQAYDALNRLSSTTDAKQGVTTFTYDARDNLTSLITMNGSIVQDLGYSLDAANNITQITYNGDNTRTQVYGYDELNRLTDATGIYGDLDYGYDANGNRLSEDLDSSSLKTYSYETSDPSNPSHHLLQTVNGGTINYSYDDNGNVIGRILCIGQILLNAAVDGGQLR